MTSFAFGPGPFLIAGPCVVEGDEVMLRVAEVLATISDAHGIPVCFKSSWDKANRASGSAPRGPGLDQGLRALERVRTATGLPLLTDIHDPSHAQAVADVVDVLQVPAFLCRQTDLLVAAGECGKPVNIKKGQWMPAEAMAGAVAKVQSGGSGPVAVTERGTFFGYGDLVVDFRNIDRMREATGAAVIFDATHAVQQPGQGRDGASGGQRQFVPALLAAAAAAGTDGFYLETHPEPAEALSDAATQWPLHRLDDLIARTIGIWHAARDLARV
ncbi:MAG: 3-deoxy-8-phosphooctulonate synthase [Gemmatimonadales bacterium]|nr:3-deoxy-8-phosphooctulonate synthase [Gemmatimonadales bacterium]MDZ4391119.1 3-deoxy-8-phosphooctulonate synthase [Gemmatimonadales bacterium]